MSSSSDVASGSGLMVEPASCGGSKMLFDAAIALIEGVWLTKLLVGSLMYSCQDEDWLWLL
jgi:hypothetical protein